MNKLFKSLPFWAFLCLVALFFPFLGYSQPIGQPTQLIPAEEHFLVLGSYKSYETAKNYADKLELEGYMPSILAPTASGNAYRVSIFHSTDKFAVEAYQNQLKQAGREAGWIHTEKFNTGDFPTNSLQGDRQNYGPSPTYYLIAGSFSGYDLALGEAQQLKNSGYDAYVLKPPAGDIQYRVTTYYTTNREEIEAYAAMLDKQNKRSGWILESFEDLLLSDNKVASANPNAGNTKDVNTQEPLTYTVVPRDASIPSQGTSTMYHLIGGSFESRDAALIFMEDLSAKGYKPGLIAPPAGGEKQVYRVSVYSAPSRFEVEQFFNQIGSKAFWILKQ